jgi:hypothetical protein
METHEYSIAHLIRKRYGKEGFKRWNDAQWTLTNMSYGMQDLRFRELGNNPHPESIKILETICKIPSVGE